MLGNGPSPPLCQYSESDVHINEKTKESPASTPNEDDECLPCGGCGEDVGNVHQCSDCNRSMHPFCGTPVGAEGFGQRIRCPDCSSSHQATGTAIFHSDKTLLYTLQTPALQITSSSPIVAVFARSTARFRRRTVVNLAAPLQLQPRSDRRNVYDTSGTWRSTVGIHSSPCASASAQVVTTIAQRRKVLQWMVKTEELHGDENCSRKRFCLHVIINFWSFTSHNCLIGSALWIMDVFRNRLRIQVGTGKNEATRRRGGVGGRLSGGSSIGALRSRAGAGGLSRGSGAGSLGSRIGARAFRGGGAGVRGSAVIATGSDRLLFVLRFIAVAVLVAGLVDCCVCVVSSFDSSLVSSCWVLLDSVLTEVCSELLLLPAGATVPGASESEAAVDELVGICADVETDPVDSCDEAVEAVCVADDPVEEDCVSVDVDDDDVEWWGRTVAQHRGLTVRVALRPLADLHLVASGFDPNVAQRGLVTPVLVHRHDSVFRVHDVHIGHRHLLRSVATGAARTVEFADVLTVEAVDLDGTVAVVLDHLVVGRTSTATARPRTRRPTRRSQWCSRAYRSGPLHLVLADDGVLECGTGLHLEHGRVGPALGLTLTRDVGALERLHLAIEDFTGLDNVGFWVLNGSGTGGPRAVGYGGGRCRRKEKSHERRKELDHRGLQRPGVSWDTEAPRSAGRPSGGRGHRVVGRVLTALMEHAVFSWKCLTS
ncbi:Zinc finger, RING/FYVE/PHD-type [Phytophthora cactorum]|nr:Zinc finger, RING/FYVE/PHD-type [Phytophthora cactorum]